MNAGEALVQLRAAGLVLDVAGEALLARPAHRITDNHRALIRAHKDALVQLVLFEPDREWMEERAAILQFDAGMTRVDAEKQASELLQRLRTETRHSPTTRAYEAPSQRDPA